MIIKILVVIFELVWLFSVIPYSVARPIPITVPADAPADDVFKINLTHFQSPSYSQACVYAQNAKGRDYVWPQIDYLTSYTCTKPITKWRYDVLNRISIYKNVVDAQWDNLCLTENTYFLENAGGGGRWVFSSPDITWDYLRLEPCTINDPRQQWRHVTATDPKDDYFVNVGSGHKIGEINWTLASAVEPIKDSLYLIEIPRDQAWLKRKAQPRSFALKVALGWEYDNQTYYDFGSSHGPVRYDPDTRQISRWLGIRILCLMSNLDRDIPGTRWAYATWVDCSDDYYDKIPEQRQWHIYSIPTHSLDKCQWQEKISTKYKVLVIDYEGSILRIKQAGLESAKPYVYRPAFIAEDHSTATYHATSVFVEDGVVADWYHLAAGNKLRSLPYCPAPGFQTKSRNTRMLPPGFQDLLSPDFILTQAWWRRFYYLVSTVHVRGVGFGVCGDCMLQSLEVILNLARFGNHPPPSVFPGILYIPQLPLSPVQQFRLNNPQVVARIQDTDMGISILDRYYDINGGSVFNPQEEIPLAQMRYFNPIVPILTPQGIFMFSEPELSVRASAEREHHPGFLTRALNFEDLEPGFQTMLNSPVNTVWFTTVYGHQYTTSVVEGRLVYTPGNTVGHAFLLVRHADGIGLIDTNIGTDRTYEQYMEHVNRRYTDAINFQSAISTRLRADGATQGFMIYSMDFFRVVRVEERGIFEQMISHPNCGNSTEGGAGGYGSGSYLPNPGRINQCGGGQRCANSLYFPTSQ